MISKFQGAAGIVFGYLGVVAILACVQVRRAGLCELPKDLPTDLSKSDSAANEKARSKSLVYLYGEGGEKGGKMDKYQGRDLDK